MIESLWKFPEVRGFLSDYPKSKWRLCLESVFFYGLNTLERDHSHNLTISELVHLSRIQDTSDYLQNFTEKISSSYRSIKSKVNKKVQTEDHAPRKIKNPVQDRSHIRHSASQTQKGHRKIIIPNENRQEIEDISIDDNLDKVSEVKFPTNLTEPHTCPIESARSMMRNESTDSFKTRLQRQGERKDWFPVIDFGSKFLNKHLSMEMPLTSARLSLGSSRS